MESNHNITAPVFVGGAAGERTGYLFEPSADLFGRRETIGFGEPDFYVALLDRVEANRIICARHYSGRVTSGSTLQPARH